MNIPKLSGEPKSFIIQRNRSDSSEQKSVIGSQPGASGKYDKISFRGNLSYESITQQKAILSKGTDHSQNLSTEAAKLNENGSVLSWKSKAENLTKVYTELYNEIVQGYENGTRQAYIIDENSETGFRSLTEEEELAALDAAYEKNIRSFDELASNQQKGQAIISEWKEQITDIKGGKAGVQAVDKLLSLIELRKSEQALYGRNKARENFISRLNDLFK